MSLVNRMLKDLEAREQCRRHTAGPAPELLRDVRVVADRSLRPGGRATSVALFLLLVGLGGWGYRLLRPQPLVTTATASESRRTAPPPPVAALLPVEQPAAAPEAAAALLAQGAEAIVPPAEPARPDAREEVAAQDRAAAEPQEPAALAHAPERAGAEPKQRGPAALATTAIPPAAGTEQPLPEIVPPSARVTKEDRPPNREEEADAAFQRGMAARAQGDPAAMEAALRQALAADATHVAARETLTAQLYRSGRRHEAKALLAGGTSAVQLSLSGRKLLARILLEEGDAPAAETVLAQGGMPEVAQDPDFFQLLAAVYQQEGRYAAAAQTYRQLLDVRRSAGVWWVGLGLALESERLGQDAAQAYRSALDGEGLSPELRSFARGRLLALKVPAVERVNEETSVSSERRP